MDTVDEIMSDEMIRISFKKNIHLMGCDRFIASDNRRRADSEGMLPHKSIIFFCVVLLFNKDYHASNLFHFSIEFFICGSNAAIGDALQCFHRALERFEARAHFAFDFLQAIDCSMVLVVVVFEK